MRRLCFWILASLCAGSPSSAAEITLQGTVSYFESWIPIPGVTVTFTTPTESVSSTTDDQGDYTLTLSAIPGPSFTWELSRLSTVADQLAINGSDAVLFNQYLAGMITLRYYQQRTADVNQDATVNLSDASALSQWLQAVTNPGNHTGTWYFEPKHSKDDDRHDFTGALLGDLDLSWSSAPVAQSEWTWSRVKEAFR